MEIQKLEKLIDAVNQLESSIFARGYAVVVQLAEERMQEIANPAKQVDRLLRPNQIPPYFGYSWRHIRKEIFPRYGVEPDNNETGQAARYLLSTIQRVQEEMILEGDQRVTAIKERDG